MYIINVLLKKWIMTKQNKETEGKTVKKNKSNIEPNILNKIIGILSIIGIPILLVMAIIGKLIETIFNLALDKFKNPISHLDGLKNALLEILSKSFFMSLYYSNLFMVQTGVHYEFKNDFISKNPDFFDKENDKKSLFSMDLSIPFVSKKDDDSKKTENESK